MIHLRLHLEQVSGVNIVAANCCHAAFETTGETSLDAGDQIDQLQSRPLHRLKYIRTSILTQEEIAST
jgi:hypothetical protein